VDTPAGSESPELSNVVGRFSGTACAGQPGAIRYHPVLTQSQSEMLRLVPPNRDNLGAEAATDLVGTEHGLTLVSKLAADCR